MRQIMYGDEDLELALQTGPCCLATHVAKQKDGQATRGGSIEDHAKEDGSASAKVKASWWAHDSGHRYTLGPRLGTRGASKVDGSQWCNIRHE